MLRFQIPTSILRVKPRIFCLLPCDLSILSRALQLHNSINILFYGRFLFGLKKCKSSLFIKILQLLLFLQTFQVFQFLEVHLVLQHSLSLEFCLDFIHSLFLNRLSNIWDDRDVICPTSFVLPQLNLHRILVLVPTWNLKIVIESLRQPLSSLCQSLLLLL